MQGKLNFINPLKRNFFIAAVVFTVGFWLIPVTQLKNLSLMPGDLGDARLNNYFLENIYQFFAGKSESLWHLPFFYDYPYVIGFSDNLFGTAPIYLVARYLLKEYDTAFQVWFLFGYLANYLAAYFGLRKLDLKILSSAIGSFIFTFAIPATAHAGHSQLHYRFGIPLTITFFIIFLKTGQWRNLVISFGWLNWQFYAGI